MPREEIARPTTVQYTGAASRPTDATQSLILTPRGKASSADQPPLLLILQKTSGKPTVRVAGATLSIPEVMTESLVSRLPATN